MIPFLANAGQNSASSGSADIGDNIANSLMLDSGSSQYLSRTFGTPTNQLKWHYHVNLKRGKETLPQYSVLAGGLSAAFNTHIAIANDASGTAGHRLIVYVGDGASGSAFVSNGTNFIRDFTGHYSVDIAYDSPNATASARLQAWVNGVAVSWATAPTITQNFASDFNVVGVKYYGSNKALANTFFDGYLSNIHFIDGQALTPSSFGRTSADTGQWVNKNYTGTYGNNGFKLDFSNSGALGTDSSGNANNWTPVNITSANQYTDTPTNNHSVFNKLSTITTSTLSVGNTKMTASSIAIGSLGMYGSMKSYWEVSSATAATLIGMYGTAATTTISVAAAKTYGMRFAAGAGTLDYINITDAGGWTSLATGLTATPYFQYCSTAASAIATINSGSKAFVGAVPSGYLALNTANLVTETVTVSGTFTGNGAADGPFVFCNGYPTTLTINSNAVTFGTHADKTAAGFKLRTASASYNVAGANTWTATIISNRKNTLKYANAQGNP